MATTHSRTNTQETVGGKHRKRQKKKQAAPTIRSKKFKTIKFEYVGPRVYGDKLIPINDDDLDNLYEENPYPNIPYASEIIKVFKKMKKDWDSGHGIPSTSQQLLQSGPTASSQQTPTNNRRISGGGNRAGSQQTTPSQAPPHPQLTQQLRRVKKHAGEKFEPTEAEILQALSENDIDIKAYITPTFYGKLMKADTDRLTIFIKNRLCYCLEWSVAFKNALIRDALGW